MTQFLWTLVIIVAIALVLALVVRVVANRRSHPAFETQPLPASYHAAYAGRMTELQAMFVEHPREAVAGAKQLVDDMTMRMGYPTRMTDAERVKDIGSVDRRHAERYRVGMALKPDSTTEEMRRALQSYLDLGRGLLQRSAPERAVEAESRREIAG